MTREAFLQRRAILHHTRAHGVTPCPPGAAAGLDPPTVGTARSKHKAPILSKTHHPAVHSPLHIDLDTGEPTPRVRKW